MSTHTPGPWKWFNYPDGRKLLISKDTSVIHAPDAPMSITPEDQLLIERAPDILKALRALVRASHQSDDPHYLQCVEVAAAVIAEVESPAPLRLEAR